MMNTQSTITPTVIETIVDIFGTAESKLEELGDLVFELRSIRDEIECVVDDRYTTMFSIYVDSLTETLSKVENKLGLSIAEVEFAIENNKLKTGDTLYSEVISPHNESKVKFYADLGSLREFKDYIHEHDPLAFDDEEDLEAFWEFAVEGRYYEKYGTYRGD